MESIFKDNSRSSWRSEVNEKHFSKVGYYYNEQMVPYHFSEHHPMKPMRIWLVHELIEDLNLLPLMTWHSEPQMCTEKELEKFHSAAYIKFLSEVEKVGFSLYKNHYGLTSSRASNKNTPECPVFDGLYEFVKRTTKASIRAADALNKKFHQIAINWSGGFHHAAKELATGFCYVNDCVLAIKELLKCHQKVMYIDIDIHHGDGVEDAFVNSDKVLTVSFHKYGKHYYPNTGFFNFQNKTQVINVPLNDGLTDENFEFIFKQIINFGFEKFQPEAIVLQCGADSLAGDPLGVLNLTIKGHSKAIEHVKTFNVPLLLLGGGGYCLQRTSRCWAYETAVALGVQDDIPSVIGNSHIKSCLSSWPYGENLHFPPIVMDNHNNEKDVANTLIFAKNTYRV